MSLISKGHERVARALARRAGVRVFRFFTRRLEPGAALVRPPGIDVRIVGEADLLPFCRDPGLDLDAPKIAAAHARGDFCAGAFEAGELVGYCWWAFARLPHLDRVWVDFHERGAWMYKSLVRPSQRGRGIAPLLYRFADDACAERGRALSISCIETHNRPSIAAIRRTGYAPAGYGGYLMHGAKLRTWCSPATKVLGVQFILPFDRSRDD